MYTKPTLEFNLSQLYILNLRWSLICPNYIFWTCAGVLFVLSSVCNALIKQSRWRIFFTNPSIQRVSDTFYNPVSWSSGHTVFRNPEIRTWTKPTPGLNSYGDLYQHIRPTTGLLSPWLHQVYRMRLKSYEWSKIVLQDETDYKSMVEISILRLTILNIRFIKHTVYIVLETPYYTMYT